MDSIIHANCSAISGITTSAVDRRFSPCLSLLSHPFSVSCSLRRPPPPEHYRRRHCTESLRPAAYVPSYSHTTNSMPLQMVQPKSGTYTVGDFMTGKDDLHVVKASTTVEEALEALAKKRITGFPVVDDEWKLVVVKLTQICFLMSIVLGSVSELKLAMDLLCGGCGEKQIIYNPGKATFIEIQKLLGKTNGKVVGDLMTPSPLVVRESTSLEDAARLLLEAKYRRLPVVEADGKLVGIITRGDVVRAALQIKRASEQIG